MCVDWDYLGISRCLAENGLVNGSRYWPELFFD